MWLAILAIALIVGACSGCGSPSPSPDPPAPTPPAADVFTTEDGVRFRVEVVATNLQVPWSLAFAPDPDGRLFVTERPGRVRIFDLAAGTSELALTLDDVFAQDEAGLLGIATSQGSLFSKNRFVFLYYTARVAGGAVNRVVRYREVGGQLGEAVVIVDNIPAHPFHDGGRLRWGQGWLHITTGDAGVASLAQDVASLAGKTLRVDHWGSTPYGAQPPNPFSSPVYSYGHRNAQGLDWHPETGDLWQSEHGPTGNDEINVVDVGANYGWPDIQGTQSRPDMRTPVSVYTPAIAPSGASFYHGDRFPAFRNNLFVATLRGEHILRLRVDGRRVVAQERLLNGRFGRIRDIAVGPDGLLYFCTSNRDGRGNPASTDDRIVRLVPAS